MLIDIMSMILVISGCILLLLGSLNLRKNHNFPSKKRNGKNFAILIPARYESRVIEGLLQSIQNQTYPIPMEDVYVIIESMEDKTVAICKKYHTRIVLRKHLDLQRKGYALDEAVKKILLKRKYDAYFIFDADNILDKDYMKEMIKTYEKGYDIGVGYRNCKNGNDSVIAACSSLTFSMINTLGNGAKEKYSANVVISGTGFYIRGYLIDQWQGYPFHSLTEDYELSLYATLHNLTTSYNNEAIFYDEQPTIYSQTVTQRIRWIKGYFTSRKEYIPKIKEQLNINNKNYGSQYSACLGVRPYIYIVIGIIMYLLKNLFFLVVTIFNRDLPFDLLIVLFFSVIFIVYFILMIITIVMLKKDKLNLNKKMKKKAILYNPIYLATYVPCALKAVLTKNVVWTRIEHKVNINEK